MRKASDIHRDIQTMIQWSRFVVRWGLDPELLRKTAIAIDSLLMELEAVENQ